MALVNGMRFPVNNNPIYQAKNNGNKNNPLLKNPELRDKMRMLSKPEAQNNYTGNSILQSSQNYADKIRMERQNSQATSLKVKKLKYKFKDISSKIISSKTSHAAKQVAGQARREVLRLKNEKRQSGEEDAELDAAIAHAKTMERVAKKKAKHLEEEELVKVGDGLAQINESEDDYDVTEDISETEELDEEYELEQEEAKETLEMQAYDDLMELTSDISEEMQEMLEEMEDYLMMDTVPGEEMDPEELKELKIKHRNREMKEIVKADAEYLKAVFDNMEKTKGADTAPVSSGMTSTFAMAPAPVNVSMPTPAIDISV